MCSSDLELGFWGDLKRILLTHELVHLFQLDLAHGATGLANAVLGKSFSPNAALPPWFIEGLAVLFESGIECGGRMGSPLFDMFLRAHAADGRLLAIDEAAGSVLMLPRGSVPYLYGSYFLAWLERRSGRDRLIAFAEEQAWKINPYSINISATRLFGKSFVELFDEWREELAADLAGQVDAIRAQGEVEGLPLGIAG